MLGHPDLIKNLDKKFGKHVKDFCSHKTPGKLKCLIVRPMEESKKISMEGQQEYQTGVGMLLYLVKHLHPNLTNMTRELSKANNVVNPTAFKNSYV